MGNSCLREQTSGKTYDAIWKSFKKNEYVKVNCFIVYAKKITVTKEKKVRNIGTAQ